MNRQYFSDPLPGDVSVSWAELVANKDCTSCAGMTDWDTGFPRIRLDPKSVGSEKFLREAMEHHETCHVAIVDAATKAHQDFDGPLFQTCMQRYTASAALTTTD
jgi:SprT-like family